MKEALSKWYKKPIGAALLQSELVGLTSVLPQIFGYYIMQIGGPINNNENKEILSASHIHNRIIINPVIDSSNKNINNLLAVQCQLEELPFLPDSIDAIIVFHALEFAQNPKLILKEIYTALMPNGYAIIFGFNPCSLWGLTPLWKKQKDTPWLGNWISSGTIRRWLSEIGFSLNDYKTFYFRPPNNNPEKLSLLEGFGDIFWPYCGASYMFIARKAAIHLTPIKPFFSFAKHFKFKAAKALPKPASRINNSDDTNATEV